MVIEPPRERKTFARRVLFLFGPMKRLLLCLSLLGLLFLTNCGKKQVVHVFDAQGDDAGSVEVQGKDGLVERSGKPIGRIESGTFLGADGKVMGKVVLENDKVLIADATGNAVGSLEAGTNCFGKAAAMVGKLGDTLPPELAAGACYLVLLAR